MMFRKTSVRTKLTLWNAGGVLVILTVLSLGIYLFMHNSLADTAKNKLDGAFNTVESVLRNSGGDIMDLYHLGPDILFAVRKNGRTVYQTKAWEEAAWTGDLDWEGYHPYGTVSERIRKYRLKKGDVKEYDYQILYAYDISDAFDSMGSLLVILLGALPFAILLSVLGGYFLAGRALNPITTITRKARQISADNLDERLAVDNPHDEFGQLAETFNRMLARLDSSFESLRRFTADASHELRTPLTSIRSVGEVALSGSLDDNSCKETIGSMLEDTEKLSHLVDSLLDMSRSDSISENSISAPVDIGSLLSEVVEELRVLAEEKSMTLTLGEVPRVNVSGDRAALRRAFSNVIHNALRYTQEKGRINVSVQVNTERGTASIDIDDDGPGIPEDERDKVFDRFYRVDKSRSRKIGGAGLGLSIARGAVESDGGTIKFCDKSEPGSRCRITLPIDISE